MATTMIFLLAIMTSSLLIPGQSQSSPAAAPVSLTPGPPSSVEGPAASGPAAAADCTTLLFGMADCLDFVMVDSKLTKPTKTCCGELGTLVNTNPVCLCELLANSSNYGVDVNRAIKLPPLCKVDTPPVSTCSLFGYNVGVPTASQGPSQGPTSAEGPSSGGVTGLGTLIAPSPTPSGGIRASVNSLAYFVATLVGFSIFFF